MTIPKQVPAIPAEVPEIMERFLKVAGLQIVADISTVMPNVHAIRSSCAHIARHGPIVGYAFLQRQRSS
jgi:hypothetical protein